MRLATLKARHAREVRALIRQALERSGWTLPGAAELLDIPKPTLQYLVRTDDKLSEERERRRPKDGSKSGGV